MWKNTKIAYHEMIDNNRRLWCSSEWKKKEAEILKPLLDKFKKDIKQYQRSNNIN